MPAELVWSEVALSLGPLLAFPGRTVYPEAV